MHSLVRHEPEIISDYPFIIHQTTKKRKRLNLRIVVVETANCYKRNYDCPPQQLH
jgi:hypothetical protein